METWTINRLVKYLDTNFLITRFTLVYIIYYCNASQFYFSILAA